MLKNIKKKFKIFKEDKKLQIKDLEEDETISTNEKGIKEIKKYDDEDGICYGLSEDNNKILINRKECRIPLWLLGKTGSGKTFFAQKEIESVILKYQKDNVVIIDQEGEYEKLTEKYGGENIKIFSNSNVRINPFDITSDLRELTEEYNFIISLKKEFLITFIEVLANGLSKIESTIVFKILNKLYDEYIEKFKEGYIIKPTFFKFYDELLWQNEKEAQEIASRIEIYVKGSLNLFAGETNIEVNKRIVNFNIKELTGDLKTATLLYICDLIFQKMDKNRKMRKYTWIYIEEISTYLVNEYVVEYFLNFCKICHPYGGIPTIISQNVEELLKNQQIEMKLKDTYLLCLLKQGINGIELLKNILGISQVQIDFVRDNKIGTGLILIEGNKLIKFKTEVKGDKI